MNEINNAFRINQTGYAEGLPVYAAVLAKDPVTLKDENGKIVPVEENIARKPDEASGDEVALVNLGELKAGTYTLESAEGKRTLTVSKEPWETVTNALIKGLYYQRCGCELKPEHAGMYSHPACHTAPVADWEDRSVLRRVTGGWHDAGDYGKYVGPGAVTVGHMLYAWKLFPEGCSDDLNIPETGNGVPDILNEARYELEWMLQMQRSDGAFHHKLTKARFAPFIMPQDDKEPEYLMPVGHCATASACACLALAYRVYSGFDEAVANRMLLAARRAWEWLMKHTDDYMPFRNPEGVFTGWYGERTDKDDRFWAACEMFAATGETVYRTEAERLYAEGQQLTAFGWADVGGMGALCCLFDMGEKAGEVLYGRLKEEFLRQSEEALKLSQGSGYGTALAPNKYEWGSILPILSNAMAMIMNSLLTGDQKMRNAALKQWDYALGMNALDICFVTGFGERRVMHPHHRPSDADGIEEPVPGLISGGPNNLMTFPMTKEKMGNTPPAKYFVEETFSADTNEIAIYWNSPAIFVGAFFNSLKGC